MDATEQLRTRWETLRGQLNERQRRLFVAAEAQVLGRGGIGVVHRITGVSEATISAGLKELRAGLEGSAVQTVRRAGGGRKRVQDRDPGVLDDLKALVEDSTRGDPQSPLRWCCKSLRSLTQQLQGQGHEITHTVVGRLLKQMGYSLQGNTKVLEGTQHPDRNAQFEAINELVKAAQAAGQPVISVDTKKKELVGRFKNAGQTWRPKGQPDEVKVHDFIDPELGRVNPYGVYDVAANEAWVSVGTDNDTARFAVNAITRWWRQMGAARYPDARELVITADGGGSNGSRVRLWKQALAEFAAQTGLIVHVRHFPPGTSKWNKIEHRLFSFITMNWRGQPLVSHEVIINLIANTTSTTGLKVRAELDTALYPKGIKIPDAVMRCLPIEREDFHAEWNYTIWPGDTPSK